MYQKFNMGMGFFIIAEKEDAEDVAQVASGAIVGSVEKGSSVRTILHKGKKLVFEGY